VVILCVLAVIVSAKQHKNTGVDVVTFRSVNVDNEPCPNEPCGAGQVCMKTYPPCAMPHPCPEGEACPAYMCMPIFRCEDVAIAQVKSKHLKATPKIARDPCANNNCHPTKEMCTPLKQQFCACPMCMLRNPNGTITPCACDCAPYTCEPRCADGYGVNEHSMCEYRASASGSGVVRAKHTDPCSACSSEESCVAVDLNNVHCGTASCPRCKTGEKCPICDPLPCDPMTPVRCINTCGGGQAGDCVPDPIVVCDGVQDPDINTSKVAKKSQAKKAKKATKAKKITKAKKVKKVNKAKKSKVAKYQKLGKKH